MGNLNICERDGCNAVVKGYAAGKVHLMTDTSGHGDEVLLMLCPADVEAVYAFLKAPVTDDRKRAYDKAFDVAKYDRETSTEGLEDSEVANLTTEQLAALLFQRTMKDAQRAIEGGSKSE